MNPCTLKDLRILNEIFQSYYRQDTILWIRERLYSPVHKIFLFGEEVAISYEMIGVTKYAVHLIGSTKRLSELRDFIIQTGSWMMDNTSCTCIIAFASVSDKRLQRFIGLTGGKRMCTIRNANGDYDEIMYVYSKDDRKELEGRVRWEHL